MVQCFLTVLGDLNEERSIMRHNIYFNTVGDARKVLAVITKGFTSNVTCDGMALSFTTPYKIREVAQISILQGVSTRQRDFNLEEGGGK